MNILGISFEEFQLQDQSNSSLDLQGMEDRQFAIFVSFAEIYNELIYDLLVETPAKGRRRPSLKISQDRHQNYFIKGTVLCYGTPPTPPTLLEKPPRTLHEGRALFTALC